MTTYTIGLSLTFHPGSTSDAPFETLLCAMLDELLAMENRDGQVVDPDLVASLADLTAEVHMEVVAASLIDAQLSAASAVRSALHAIEVGTPGWEAAIASFVRQPRLQDA